MATFNTTAVVSPIYFMMADIAIIWPPEFEATPPLTISYVGTVLSAQQPRFQYSDGIADGERFGFSSQREETMEPIQLGETDPDKMTIGFPLFDTDGQPASGLGGQGAVAVPAAGELQTNRDLGGYVNALGTFSHIGDGNYRYTFVASEVASAGGEGVIWLRVAVAGFRTVVWPVPIRNLPPQATAIRDAVLNAARSGFVGTGTIGEGLAIAASLLQGNYYMDNITNTDNGQTEARIRCFHTGAAANAATQGGTGEGEFATFLVTTSYTGPNKISEHRVVQQ